MGLFDWLRGKTAAPEPAAASDPVPADAGLGVPHAFLDKAEAILRALAPVESVRRPPGQGALAFTFAGKEQTLHFHHLFGELRDCSPEVRKERLEFFIGAVLAKEAEPDLSWSDARPHILPLIRAGTYGAYLTEEKELGPQPIRRDVLPFLVEVLVVDRPASMALIASNTVERWAVLEEVVRRAAYENVEALRDTPLEPYLDRFGGISCLPGTDDYATTRLLLPGWLASQRVAGRPLAVMPDRSTLFIAGDADPGAAGWLAETAQREWRATSRAISPVVYTCDDSGAVVPYRRSESEELGRLLRAGEELLLVNEYKEQQQLLVEMYDRDGIDLFIASATLVQRKDGCQRSYCVWTEGVESLLPRTDALVVQSQPPPGPEQDGWRYFVPFDRAREVTGDAWTVADVPAGPVRFRTPGPIDPTLRERLARAAIPFEQVP
jgi:hypothetical protein